jgi:hypothetical protein
MIARAGLVLCLVAGHVHADTLPGKNMDLAFVLLPKAGLPNGKDVVNSFGQFATEGQSVETRSVGAGQKDVLEFHVKPCGTAFVAAMPAPVPRSEAEEAARFSISALGSGRKLPTHAAHLIVTLPASDSRSRFTTLSCFTSLLAAVSTAAGAIGVYWGNAGATHHADFFASVAQEPGLASRLMLWTGVSIAREPDGRLSYLSLGMQQLDVPDLLLVVPKSLSGNEALGTLLDLLAYVAQLGEALPEGDTVGRTVEERLPVHYVPSPVDPSKRVWRVEIR